MATPENSDQPQLIYDLIRGWDDLDEYPLRLGNVRPILDMPSFSLLPHRGLPPRKPRRAICFSAQGCTIPSLILLGPLEAETVEIRRARAETNAEYLYSSNLAGKESIATPPGPRF